ncbi:FG-GAP repeat [Carpediemonas membranifera]|uniref:FG-GAP repeat n=1 Tax=Carpediemonas membranifera TaxID=201153 RepID=A0A8J6C139_9EUKA|nr:FG-GAP repeat [Carpediemonas membranifera]|eukprot:KAG9397191.1 FG-GAP repeat [Carpediemonas membranifera]
MMPVLGHRERFYSTLLLVFALVSLSSAVVVVPVRTDALITNGDTGSSFGEAIWIIGDTLFAGASSHAPGEVQYGTLPQFSSPSSLPVPTSCTARFGAQLAGTDRYVFATCTTGSEDVITAFDVSDLSAVFEAESTTVPLNMAAIMKVSPDQSTLVVASTTSATAMLFDIDSSASPTAVLTPHGLPFALDGTPTDIAISNTHILFSWLSSGGYIDSYTFDGVLDTHLALVMPDGTPAEVVSMDACEYAVLATITDGTNFAVRVLSMDLEFSSGFDGTTTIVRTGTGLSPSCSYAVGASAGLGRSETYFASIGEHNTREIYITLAYFVQTSHADIGSVVTATDSWVAFGKPSSEIVMAVPICRSGSKMVGPYEASTYDDPCIACSNGVSNLADITECSTIQESGGVSMTPTTPIIAVSGNLFMRGDPDFSSSAGAVYLHTVDDFINNPAPTFTVLLGSAGVAYKYGSAVAASDFYAVVGTDASTPNDGYVKIYDIRYSLSAVLLSIAASDRSLSNFGGKAIVVHPSKPVFAATAVSSGESVVVVYYGADFVSKLQTRGTVDPSFGYQMIMTENHLFICNFIDQEVYKYTLASFNPGTSGVVSFVHTYPRSGSNDLKGVAATDTYTLVVDLSVTSILTFSLFDSADTAANPTALQQQTVAVSNTAPPVLIDCDQNTGKCAVAHIHDVYVFDLSGKTPEADILSSGLGAPYAGLSTAGDYVVSVAINNNAIFITGAISPGMVYYTFTACQGDLAVPQNPAFAAFSPSFQTCEHCPAGWYSTGFDVACRPIPFGDSIENGKRLALAGIDLTPKLSDIGFSTADVAAKNHLLAASDGSSKVALFDVDFTGLHGHGPFLTKPNSVGSSVFGSAVAVTDSGHVIVGSPTASGVAHGISIFELTHDSAVYVRSFFKYVPNCEYGDSIATHGDYVAVSAPGSACEAVDVYSTVDWTKSSLRNDGSLSAPSPDSFGTHIAIDNDYLYASGVWSGQSVVFALGGFKVPSATLSVAQRIDPYAGVGTAAIAQIIADPATETLFVSWEASDLKYGVYRRCREPNGGLTRLAVKDTISPPPLSFSYFNGERYIVASTGQTFSSSTNLLDVRSRATVTNAIGTTDYNGKFTLVDGLPIFHSAANANQLGVLLPTYSDALPGEELLAGGYYRPCPDGYFSPGLQALCTKCPPHYASNTDHTACVPEYTVSTVDPGVAVTAISTYKDAMAAVSYTEGCGTDTGSVFLHVYDGTAWALTETLTPPASGCVGLAVTINDDWLAVSSEFDDGLVLVYSRSTLDLTASLTPADAGTGFGWSLALAGDSLLVGAPTSSANGQPGAGVVFVFEFDSSSGWPTGPDHTLSATVPSPSERFGASIDVKIMSDGSFAVAVRTAPSSNPGSVFMFDTPSWSVSQAAIGTDPSFGHEVAVISHDELFTAESDEVIRIHFHDFIYDAYIIDSAVTAAYGDALGAFGDQVVSSATSYSLYGHDTGAFTVSGYEPTPSSMGDAGFLLPPSERLVDSMGFGQPASTMGSGVMFATDAQSTAITCIHPTCTAGQHADTWYSCADCPPYTVGDGQTCANYTAPTVHGRLVNTMGLATEGDMIVSGTPYASAGFSVAVCFWAEDWATPCTYLVDDFSGDSTPWHLGFDIGLADDWLVTSAYQPDSSSYAVVVFTRSGKEFYNPSVVVMAGAYSLLVDVSGDSILVVDKNGDDPSSSFTTIDVYKYSLGSQYWAQDTTSTRQGVATSAAIDGDKYAVGFPYFGSVRTDAKQAGSWGTLISDLEELGGAGSFGQSIALEGNTMIVGAPDVPDVGGAMYAYVFTANQWVLNSAAITPNDPRDTGRFPTNIAIHDGHVAAGWSGCKRGADTGCVLLFDPIAQSGGLDVYAQTAIFSHPSSPMTGDFLAIGDKIILTMGMNDIAGAGTTYVLTLNALCPIAHYADTWYSCAECPDNSFAPKHRMSCTSVEVGEQITKARDAAFQVSVLSAVISGSTSDDKFGITLSANGDLVAIGSTEGYAYVYQVQGLLGDPFVDLVLELDEAGTLFGSAVAICSSWLAVRASASSVVVYAITSGPEFTVDRTFSSAVAGFGANLVVDDTLLIISNSIDAIILFEHDGTDWLTQVQVTGPASSGFGYSIAMTDNYFFVGAPNNDAVYAYERSAIAAAMPYFATYTSASSGVSFGSTLAAVESTSGVLVAVGCPGQTVGSYTGAVQILSMIPSFSLEETVSYSGGVIPTAMLLDETALLASASDADIGIASQAGTFVSFQYNSVEAAWTESRLFSAITPTANEQVGQAIAAGDACVFYSSTPTGSPGNVYVTCAVCPAGQKPVSWRLCEPCPAGMYSEAGWPECRACPAGYTINTDQTGCDAPYTAESHSAPPPIVAGELGTVVRIQGDQVFALYGTKTMTPNVERYTYSSATKAWEDAGMVLSSSALATPAAHTASFDVSEHWLAVGSPSEAKVYVYSRADASFDQLDALEPSGLAGPPTSFGSAIAMTDVVIVSGTPDTLTGQVDVFSFNGAHWEPQFVFTSSLTAAGDLFGASVAISPGASFIVASDPLTSKVYVLNYTAELTGSVTESQTIAGSGSFGMALAATETTIVVGAPTATVLGVTGAGSATVLTLVDGAWTPLTTLTAPYPESEGFGSSVAIDEEDTIVVGAPDYNSGVGRAHFIAYDGSDWAYHYSLDSADSTATSFGTSVASNTQFLAVGAPALNTDAGGLTVMFQPCSAKGNGYMASWRYGCESCPFNQNTDTYCRFPTVFKSVHRDLSGSTDSYFGYAIAATDDFIALSTHFAPASDDNVVTIRATMNSYSDPSIPVATMTVSDAEFGKSMDMNDGFLVVGASNTVEIYRIVQTAFVKIATKGILPAEPSFGDTLLLWGNYLAVGAPDVAVGSSSIINGAGVVVIYELTESSATMVATITLDGVAGRGADALGTSLVEHGGTLFIGAPGANTVFAVDESDWSTITQVITATLPTATVSFGSFMAYDDVNDLLLISDPDADMFGTAQGAVVAFELDADTSEWTQLTWIRSMYSDMTNFGQTLAASNGFFSSGSPDFLDGANRPGSLEVMAFDNSTRRYVDFHFGRVTDNNAGATIEVLSNAIFYPVMPDDDAIAQIRLCPAGTYSTFWTCEPCPPGQWSKSYSRYCELPPPGREVDADQTGTHDDLTTATVAPAGSSAGTGFWGTATATYGDNLVLAGGSVDAYLFTRGDSGWVEMTMLTTAFGVQDVAIDSEWLVLVAGFAGTIIYRLDPRSVTQHSSFVGASDCFKVGLVDGNIAALNAYYATTDLFEYDPVADTWDESSAAFIGDSLAVHADYFVVGDGPTLFVTPWPSACTGVACTWSLPVNGSDAVLMLDDLTIFTANTATSTIEVLVNKGTTASPSWTISQTLTDPDGGTVSLAASGRAVFAGIPSHNSEDGAVRVISKHNTVWMLDYLITGLVNFDTQLGASLSASESTVVMGAPANTGSPTVPGTALVATVFCPANSYSDSFHTCAACPTSTVSKAGAVECSACPAGTTLSSSGNECVHLFDKQTLTVSTSVGSSLALSDLLVATVPDLGDLIMARFDPFTHTWTQFSQIAALTAEASRLVVTDDFILFGDPYYNLDEGRVGVIRRYGFIFEDIEFIDAPTSDTFFFGWQIDVSDFTLIASSSGGSIYTYDLADGSDIDTQDFGDSCYNFAVYGRMMVCSSNIGMISVYPDFADKDTSVNLGIGPNSAVADFLVTDDLILVGSPHDTSNSGNSIHNGAVYVYLNDGVGYPLQTLITRPDLSNSDAGFGSSIAQLDADNIAIGAPGDPGDINSSGQMYWVTLNATNGYRWVDSFATSVLPGSMDQFASIKSASDGGAFAISAPEVGKVNIFTRKCPAGSYTTSLTACTACPTGTVSAANSMACHPCPAGLETNSGQTACVEILEGKRFEVDGSNQGFFDVHEGLATVRRLRSSELTIELFSYSEAAGWVESGTLVPLPNNDSKPTGLTTIIMDEHIIVGGYGGTDLNPGRTTGAALIYDRWSLELVQQILPPDDSLASDSFSFTGTRVGDSHIILSDYHATASDGSLLAGAIHLYRLVLDEWAWVDSFAESGTVGYGWHAAARESTVAVSTQEFAPYTTAGAQVFVYQFNGSTLTPVTSVTLTGYQYIGKAMDISPDEDTLAVACLDPTVPAADTYAVFEFNISTSVIVTVAEGTWALTNSAKTQSLAHAGDAIYHGCAYDKGMNGSIVVYDRVAPGFWSAAHTLTIPGVVSGEAMGMGLKITDSGLIVVGYSDIVIYSRYDCPVDEVATSWLECGPVPSGSIAYSNSHTRCLNGSYADNSTTCVPCDAGTYQPNKGSTECLSADAGFFVPDDGYAHTAPIECPVATSQTAAESTSCTRSYGIQTLDLGVSSYTPAVALDDDLLLVGLPETNQVSLYTAVLSVWTPNATVTPPSAATDFGHAMVLRDDWLAVGAPSLTDAGAGAVFVYTRDGHTFPFHSTLTATSTAEFGKSLDLQYPLLAALAWDDSAGTSVVEFFLYDETNEEWIDQYTPTAIGGVALTVGIMSLAPSIRFAVGMADESRVCAFLMPCTAVNSVQFSRVVSATSGETVAFGDGALDTGFSGHRTAAGSFGMWVSDTDSVIWPDFDPIEDQGLGRAVAVHGTTVAATDAFGAVHLYSRASGSATATVHVYLRDDGFDPDPGFGHGLAVDPMSMAVVSLVDGAYELSMIGMTCDAGNYADSWHSCAPCPAGSYSPAPGYWECVDAPPGSVVPSDGRSTPEVCDGGHFADSPGADICQTCGTGSTNDADGHGHSTCLSEVENSTTSVEVSGRSDIDAITVDGVAATIISTSPVEIIPIVGSSDGAIHPGDYELEVEFSDSTIESTTLTIPADFETPDTTLTLSGTTLIAAMESRICPSNLPFAAMGVRPLTGILTAGTVTCVSDETVSGSNLADSFSPSISKRAEGEYCLTMTDVTLTGTTAFAILIDDEEQALVLSDNAICSTAASASTSVSTQVYLSADTRTIVATFDGTEIASDSETYNEVSVLYAVIPSFAVASLLLLGCLCCTCILAMAGSAIVVEVVMLFRTKTKGSDDEDLKPQPIVGSTPTVLPPMDLPPLLKPAMMPTQPGRSSLNSIGGMNVPVGVRPTLPAIRPPLGQSPNPSTASPMKLPPNSPPAGTPPVARLPPTLGRSGLPPLVGMPRPGVKLVLSPMQLPGVGLNVPKKTD